MNAEHEYFKWLCGIVGSRQRVRDYGILLLTLHHTDFISYVDHDENRAYDGMELRDEFLEEVGRVDWGGLDMDAPCSLLEMMIGLARRMDFETSDPYEDDLGYDRTAFWFWEMIDNLGLSEIDDETYAEEWCHDYVETVLQTLVERRYSYDGEGGLFPLSCAGEDQRDIEIWYQMSAYLAEREN